MSRALNNCGPQRKPCSTHQRARTRSWNYRRGMSGQVGILVEKPPDIRNDVPHYMWSHGSKEKEDWNRVYLCGSMVVKRSGLVEGFTQRWGVLYVEDLGAAEYGNLWMKHLAVIAGRT